jgi:hypothetical protein
MQAMLKRLPDGLGKGKMKWRTVTAAAVMGVTFSLATGMAPANEDDVGETRAGSYESRFYGTVEKAPRGNIGTWVVNKRDIAVTKETRIIEKHGKAAAGAYVEVEGSNTGKNFTAFKIEVKRSKR